MIAEKKAGEYDSEATYIRDLIGKIRKLKIAYVVVRDIV